jgi:anti-sigma B factor antagonist
MTALVAQTKMPQGFDVTVERDGRRTSVAVVGELDPATVPVLERVWVEQARRGGLVVLDLRALSFIDASGIGLLLRIDADARRDGIELRLMPSARVLRLLKLCRLDARFRYANAPPDRPPSPR